jgi:hypothetical protein
MAISSRVSTRIATQIKKYQGILSEIQKKDIKQIHGRGVVVV